MINRCGQYNAKSVLSDVQWKVFNGCTKVGGKGVHVLEKTHVYMC